MAGEAPSGPSVGPRLSSAPARQKVYASSPQQTAHSSRQRQDIEEIRRVGRIHYQELFSFLRSHLAKDQTGPRSNAREKLTRLSKQQFTELSTDVYDELMRRVNNSKDLSTMPHLAVRDEFHPKRNQARQKLSTLPKTRFKDLSSDVFFELERRYPELKEEYRPDAVIREREAALRKEKEEAEAAAPAAAASSATVPEQQKQLQGGHTAMAAQESTSDVIVPVKSTLVEENISVPYKNGRNNDIQNDDGNVDHHGDEAADNRSTMYSQGSSVGTGFFNRYSASRGAATESASSPNLGIRFSQMESPGPFGIEKLRSEYEFRIATLNKRVAALEAHNVELKEHASKGDSHKQALQEARDERRRIESDHAEEFRQLQKEFSQYRQKHEETSRALTDAHRKLESVRGELERALLSSGSGEDVVKFQEEIAQQGQIIQELRAEVESLVQEISQLSARNEELIAEKDQDLLVISDLNQQVQSYKRRYEQAKVELRQYKATSQLFVTQPKVDEFLIPTEKGAIADVNVTAFQTSIDELLTAARSTTPSSVIVSMKSVVLATTLLTDDVAKFEQTSPSALSAAEVEELSQLKPRISTSLNNLMTACRNHAASRGVSPLSLLDAAASHVSTTVVDLVKLVRIRPATSAEKEQFEAHFCSHALLPSGLKPLHMGSGPNAAGIRSTSLAPISPVDQGSEFRGAGSGPTLQSGLDAIRLSPRTVKTVASAASVHGRYSPVGYRPSFNRTDSASDWAWKAGGGRALSGSSATSSSLNGGTVTPGTMAGNGSEVRVPALPRTDLSTIKHQWGQASPPRQSISVMSSARAGAASTSGPASTIADANNSSRHVNEGSFEAPISSSTSLGGVSAVEAGQPPPTLGDDTSEENWAELRNYIEVQTEAIVHSIQALLSAIREGAQGVQLNENLVQITTIASSIVVISRENLPPSSREEGESILGELQENCDRLSEMQTRPEFDKSAKSAMASASYGVAKGLKALNGLLNAVDVASPGLAASDAVNGKGISRSQMEQC